jgi:hypothetical protein
MTEDIAWKRADWADVTIWTSYLRAAHFVLFHMASIGSGDVRPQNAWETGFIMVLVLVSASMFAYLIGLISSYARLGDVQEELLQTGTAPDRNCSRRGTAPDVQEELLQTGTAPDRNCSRQELLQTQTDYLQHYMRHHPLPHMLAKRIASYYRVGWTRAREHESS